MRRVTCRDAPHVSYAWNAADYARHSAGQQKWALDLLDEIDLAADDVVLDLGCGDGKVTAEIARRVPLGRVLGVDLSADMIRHATETYPPTVYPNLAFGECDARELTFEGAFSLVFSNAALHWVRDHRPVLQGISRALRPGGRCVMQMGGFGNFAEVLRAFEHVMAAPRWRPSFEGFASTYGFHHPDDYRLWLVEAGLVPWRVELIPKDMPHASRDAFTGWLRTAWHPYTTKVPVADRDAFIDEVVARHLEAHPADADGSVNVIGIRLQVHAAVPP